MELKKKYQSKKFAKVNSTKNNKYKNLTPISNHINVQ